jgi:Acyclic terpene utilisation family protein AtuA
MSDSAEVKTSTQPIRIANCSGFFGDRMSAAREMVEGGPIDVLTGDWLAELTMYILSRTQAKRPGGGYARTFVTQMGEVLGTCVDRGIKVVTNAGGLDPAGCAAAVEALRTGAKVAYVTGDDVSDRLAKWHASGMSLAHLDTGEPLSDVIDRIVTANAYLGCWGIVEALRQGADVVITGRATDAAIVMAPAAWHHGWAVNDWDALAGACVAGHVIECGTQTTGGNYSFFTEIADMRHPGFPWAEIAADGSSVIGKHDGTGGAVNLGTVTSQLLYEISGHQYANPDVVARFDTIHVAETGPDRVTISGVGGEPAPPTAKLALNYLGGYRNSMSFALTGLNIEAKAALIEDQLWSQIPGGRDIFDEVDVSLVRSDDVDPATNESATAWLRITVKEADESKVGRAFSSACVELGLTSIPGFYGGTPPGPASAYGVYWPTLIPAELITQHVHFAGSTTDIPAVRVPGEDRFGMLLLVPPTEPLDIDGKVTKRPLGDLFGARSGDKGGNANLGVFARSDDGYAWLEDFLTVDQLRALMPTETEGRQVERHVFPNLRSLNFVIVGLLGRGVAESTRQDAQAKSLGEYLRAKVVDIPTELVNNG